MFSKADRDLAECAAGQHGVFTLADARACGLSDDQVDWRVARAWVTVYEGVFRMPGAVATKKSELLAACLAAPTPAAVSHRSAAWLYEMPGGNGDLAEITCRRWRRSQRNGIIVHESTRFQQCDVSVVDGISVVTPDRLLFDLASIWPSADFIEKVIHAARRRRLITFESASATFDQLARRGVRGVNAVRVALDRWDPTHKPTESEMETMLVQVLREQGLPEPVTQFEVRDEDGRFVARADAALPEWRITFEYQSKQEHSNEFQLLQDDRRRNAIIAAGYHPLAARYEDLRTGGAALVAEVRRIVRRLAS